VQLETPQPAPALKRLRRFLRAQLLSALVIVAQALPLPAALWLGGIMGRASFVLARRQRGLALAHLAMAFPQRTETERIAIARASFESLGRMALELTQVRKIDRRMKRYVDWPEGDIAAVRRALFPDKGGLFITGHIGNWELLARRIVAEGFDHLVVGRTPGDPGMTAIFERLRRGGGVRVVDRSALSARREILEALKRGALVGLLIDQDTRVQGLFVPFFGRPAHTPRAAEDLAGRMGMPVFVGFIHRRPDGGHELRTEELSPAGANADGLTDRLTARIEAEIRRQPSDWVWMHRRWRQQPEAMP
jgi:KDO2-lipid IV(A) lauroyltransferase